MSPPRPRVVIAEDHVLVREGMRQLLAADFDVVAVVDDGRDLLQTAEATQPDLILLDISMPRLNGLDAARQLARGCPDARLICVTMHEAPAYVQAAFAAGAHGVESHRACIARQLGVRSPAGFTRHAVRYGLVSPLEPPAPTAAGAAPGSHGEDGSRPSADRRGRAPAR